MRSPEDREPKDGADAIQEAAGFRYELTVRLASPWKKRLLIVRHYEDGRDKDWVLVIDGPSMV